MWKLFLAISGSRDNSLILKVLKDVIVPDFTPKSGIVVINEKCSFIRIA